MTTLTKFAHVTCDVCEVVRDGIAKTAKGFWNIGVSFGHARAAAELSALGFHEEAKKLILSKH